MAAKEKNSALRSRLEALTFVKAGVRAQNSTVRSLGPERHKTGNWQKSAGIQGHDRAWQ
jgi:hypothetical protein